MSHNKQKKIAIINDFSGFGRCSITVALPIISAMKIQCCPIPTAILSNHVGYPSYFFDDYTEKMEPYIQEWKKMNLRFDGISTGFLGSKEQIEIVTNFFQDFRTKENIIVVDPVMGDAGKRYSTYSKEMCQEMIGLVKYADILTPNITEACILTGREYKERWKIAEVIEIADRLREMGPGKIVITGIVQGDFIANFCFEENKELKIVRSHKVGTQRSGTGDIFAAIITADAVNGVPFRHSVKKASNFVKKCLIKTMDFDIPIKDGVCFEEILSSLGRAR